MKRITRGLCAALLGLATSAVGLPAAGAADGGLLRLAHLSPDTPAVDVYVDSVADPSAGVVLPGVAYGTVSDYRDVPPGSYTISMRPTGAAAVTPPVLSTTVQVGGSSARTVAGVGYFADLGLEVLEDDLAPPPAGRARVRVVAAAATAERLDVSLADDTAVASDLEFASTTGYVDVPAGRTELKVATGSGEPTTLPLDVASGSVYSVMVLDRPGGGLTVQPALDAASPGVVPVGGVETGAGGTAGSSPAVLAAVGLAALTAAGLLVSGRRLPRRSGPARHGGRS